jgi:MltA-interacting protein MipA
MRAGVRTTAAWERLGLVEGYSGRPHRLTDHWRLFGAVGYSRLFDDAKDSPLVDDVGSPNPVPARARRRLQVLNQTETAFTGAGGAACAIVPAGGAAPRAGMRRVAQAWQATRRCAVMPGNGENGAGSSTR